MASKILDKRVNAESPTDQGLLSPQPGLLVRGWRYMVGERDRNARELRAATSHGAVMLFLARWWSLPLMLVFSLGAVVTLCQRPLAHTVTLVEGGRPPDIAEAIDLVVTIVLVIGMDLALPSAALQIGDGWARRARWQELSLHYFIAVLVSVLEAWTFHSMIANGQAPSAQEEAIFTWLRACAAPVVAVYCATLRRRAVTRKDIEHLAVVRAGEGVIAYVEAVTRARVADPSATWDLYTHLEPGTEEERVRDEELKGIIRRLVPGRDVAHSPDAMAGEIAALQITPRPVACVATHGDLVEDNVSGSRLAMQVREIPPSVRASRTAQSAPDEVGVTPVDTSDSGAHEAGRVQGEGASDGDEGASDGDEGMSRGGSGAHIQREFLRELGLEPIPTPLGRKGVFLQATDLPLLTDGKVAGDQARELIKALGRGERSGKPYVARFERVVADLFERNVLADPMRSWWARQVPILRDFDAELGNIDAGEVAAVRPPDGIEMASLRRG